MQQQANTGSVDQCQTMLLSQVVGSTIAHMKNPAYCVMQGICEKAPEGYGFQESSRNRYAMKKTISLPDTGFIPFRANERGQSIRFPYV